MEKRIIIDYEEYQNLIKEQTKREKLLEDRIDKAIDFIKKNYYKKSYSEKDAKLKQLLDILTGYNDMERLSKIIIDRPLTNDEIAIMLDGVR